MDRAESSRATAGAAGLALATAAPVRESATAQASKPNILLIMTDDQPYHTWGSWNRSSAGWSPRDEFHQRLRGHPGLRTGAGLRDSQASGPTTPDGDPIGAWQDLVDSGELARNIAKRLNAVGYSCHLTGKFTNNLRNDRWVCPGFESSWWARLEDLNNQNPIYFSKGGDGRIDIPRDGTQAGNETMVAATYTERFIRSHRDAPWFALLAARPQAVLSARRYASTHRSDRPPTPYGERGKDLSDKATLVRKRARFSARPEILQEYRGKLREIEEVDDAVDRLMTALTNTNQIGRTWVFFVTDNGFQHGEHYLGGKLWPYEESTRTPFMVRGPGVPADTNNGHLVSQVDLLPTICDLAGADASGVDGRSIRPVLRNPGSRFREFLLVEAEGRGWHSVRMRRWNKARADHENLLFVRWRDGFEELYDYDDDPHLFNGRANTPRERENASMLRKKLLAMRKAAGGKYRALETG